MRENDISMERERLESILERAGVPTQKKSVLLPVIDNMAWQRIKLDEAREEMKSASIICTYDNGGGQSGTRENPIFKAYINLWRAYMVGLEKFSASLPKEMQEEVAAEATNILAQVRSMKG